MLVSSLGVSLGFDSVSTLYLSKVMTGLKALSLAHHIVFVFMLCSETGGSGLTLVIVLYQRLYIGQYRVFWFQHLQPLDRHHGVTSKLQWSLISNNVTFTLSTVKWCVYRMSYFVVFRPVSLSILRLPKGVWNENIMNFINSWPIFYCHLIL